MGKYVTHGFYGLMKAQQPTSISVHSSMEMYD